MRVHEAPAVTQTRSSEREGGGSSFLDCGSYLSCRDSCEISVLARCSPAAAEPVVTVLI